MPGVDHDSLELLKEAKTGKHVFFALVAKGGTTGKLMAGKSKISPGDIAAAKKEVSGSAVVQGRCQGGNGGLIFETVRETAPAITSLTKKLLKESGFLVDCEYRINENAESDDTSDHHVQGTVQTPPPSGKPPTTPPPRPQRPPQGQTPPITPQTEELTLNMGDVLQPRLLMVGRWMKEKKTELPDVVAKMEHAFMECGTAFKEGAYETCEPILDKLEEVIRRFKGQSPPTPQGKTPPTQPPRGTGPTPPPKTTTETPPNTTVPPTTTPPTTRPRGGSLPPQQETRPRSVSSPGVLPDSHGDRVRGDFDHAKEALEAFKTNPNAGLQTTEARQKIETLKGEMTTLLEAELAAEDDIKRKGLVFDSVDANYKKNVTEVVKRAMEAVRPALENPANDPIGPIQTLDQAITALATARAHYADMSGITDTKHLDQRRRKVAAIEAHQAELRKIIAKLRQIVKMKAQPVIDMLNATKELNDADPGAGGPQLKEFGRLLNDEATRKALFQSVGPEQTDGLLAMMEAQDSATMDRFASELAKTRASDSEYMDGLCKKAIQKEALKATDKGTFFRGNSMATKLAGTYVMNSPSGKAYCEQVGAKLTERAKGKGPLEIDPDKGVSGKDLEKNLTAQKKMLGPTIDDLTSDPNSIPPEMAKICGLFYDEAKRVSGGDEDFATTQSGGFAMLRIIVPTMNRLAVENTNAQKSESARTKAGNDQRLVLLQSKIFQNMSNGARFDKEPFMKPVEDQIFTDDGGYTPQTSKLRNFLKDIAVNAPRD